MRPNLVNCLRYDHQAERQAERGAAQGLGKGGRPPAGAPWPISLAHTHIAEPRQRAGALLKLQLSTLEQSGSRQQSPEALPTADCGRSRQRDARGEP